MYDVHIFYKKAFLDFYNFLLWTTDQLQLIEESYVNEGTSYSMLSDRSDMTYKGK